MILQNATSFDQELALVEASPINFFLEVDAEFPQEIHDKMNDFPFLPEQIKPPGDRYVKLIAHLGHRKNYIISLEMFLLARQEGVKFSKIHRVLQFDQAPWLRSYMELNTNLRQATSDPFQQDYYKLMNNSAYGKMLEQVTKYINFKLFTTQNAKKFKVLHERKPYLVKQKLVYHRCSTHTACPRSAECSKEEGCVVGMELKKLKAVLSKPSYAGVKVLENSKLVMYRFYYHVLKPLFGERMRVLGTDTDSFILEIISEDIVDDLNQIRSHMDFSNLAKNNPLFDVTNRKVPGKFKIEYPDDILTKFAGLRSKSYCLETLSGNVIARAKGTKKSVVRKTLKMQDYEKCLNEQALIYRTQHLLRSRLQRIFSIKQSKVSLSAMDTKRFLKPDCQDSLAWGHYAAIAEDSSDEEEESGPSDCE